MLERFKFRNISLFNKIITVTIVTTVILVTGFLFFVLPMIENHIKEEKITATRDTVDVAYSMVEKYYAFGEVGIMTKRDAKQKALDLLRGLRFKGKEYFFILNADNTHMIMHPIKPSLNGKNVSNTKDVNGVYIFRELVKVSSNEKGGAVSYMWPKAGEKVPSPKITYAKPFRQWGWIVASGIYVDDIKESINSIRDVVFLFLAVIVAVSLILSFVIARYISKPVKQSLDLAESIARGDLTRTLDVKRGDETGVLSEALNKMAQNLRNMFTEIADGAITLSSSSTELAAISEQMNSSAEQTTNRVENVINSANEVNSRVNTITESAELSLENVTSVAKEADDMANAIDEISKNTEKANLIVKEAVTRAKEILQTIEELGGAASDISDVTDTITDISEQTNLLALNATIEAARAGESGKGFAVVAGEIKGLANQTSIATSQIDSRITTMQGSTGDVVGKIKEISSIIEGVEGAVLSISEAVHEQSQITRLIAEHATSVTEGIEVINKNLFMATEDTGIIVKDIDDVNSASVETADSSKNVKYSAGDLSVLSEQLTSILNQYKYTS